MPALVTADPVPWGWESGPSPTPPCRWGPCGHCHAHHHERCQFLRWPASERRSNPHTWVLNGRGHVTFPHVAVYVVGAERGWVCSCHAAGHDQGQPGQVALW